MSDTWRIGGSGILALLLTLWCMPLAISLAHRCGLIDRPGDRKLHQSPTPLVGGVTMFLAIMAVVLLLSVGSVPLAEPAAAVSGGRAPPRGLALLMGWPFPIACLVAFLTGLVDDWRKSRGGELPIWGKLAGQAAAAAILMWGGGFTISYVSNPFGPGMLYLSNAVDYPLTLLWLVGMTNAINFIDGLDGLAGGVVAVATFTLTVVAFALGATVPGIWAAAILGACIGFLRYNFPPARVFMGDAGSNFLGFALAAIALLGYFKTATLAGLVVPLFALSLPLMNGVFVVVRRMLLGRPIYSADHEHAFDILRRRGWSTVETLLIFLLLAMVMSAAGMGVALRPGAMVP